MLQKATFRWFHSLKKVAEGFMGNPSVERQWDRGYNRNTSFWITHKCVNERWSPVRNTAVVDKVHVWVVAKGSLDGESKNGTSRISKNGM